MEQAHPKGHGLAGCFRLKLFWPGRANLNRRDPAVDHVPIHPVVRGFSHARQQPAEAANGAVEHLLHIRLQPVVERVVPRLTHAPELTTVCGVDVKF
eukprot:CAMPEP_0179893784 /NCGR_PEP_ID=MMETSP0982-20121206/34951_1 /TAXON_ID=483367 /ORGANISM="non described non described, Strain CCMP 2436" /LENGTH=96 /DNA_ID=CAMNT_0021790359 /DNA_START=87 /DNA_END=378 /DNA_ORIENTATION=-